MIPIFGSDMWILLHVVFARHAWHATDIDSSETILKHPETNLFPPTCRRTAAGKGRITLPNLHISRMFQVSNISCLSIIP